MHELKFVFFTQINTDLIRILLSLQPNASFQQTLPFRRCGRIRTQQLDSHVDVWRLEAPLVDVVEGEGLRGVGAVLVHLHRRPGAALGGGLTLRLLPPRRHDF